MAVALVVTAVDDGAASATGTSDAMFELSRESGVPLVEQICERLTLLVRQDQLAPGHPSALDPPARAPDRRESLHGGGRLRAPGGARPDRIARRARLLRRPQRRLSAPLAAVEALPDPGTDALALARLTLAECTDLIPAGSGFLPENWLLEALPASELTRLVKKRRAQPWLPCPPQGLIELREHIAARLVQNGIAAGAANIVTTFGASQAFDLLARILFSPGDAVLVEDPGYFVLFEQLRAHHVRLIPVPRARGRSGPRGAGGRLPCTSPARLLHADAAAQSDRLERGRRALPSHPLARRAVRLRDHRGRRVR